MYLIYLHKTKYKDPNSLLETLAIDMSQVYCYVEDQLYQTFYLFLENLILKAREINWVMS